MKLFKKQIIEAHRGAKGLVKFENTIEAFAKAIEVGSDGIELDVRKTKDNIIVVRHDADIKGNKICDLTKDELDEITKKEGFICPTLEETILYCKGKILLDIEVKEAGYEEEILKAILKHLSYDEFYIRSFIDKTVRKFKKLDKNVITILLIGRWKPKFGMISRLPEIFPLFKILHSKCDMVSPYYKLLVWGYVKRMHFIGIPVIPWTVDGEENLRFVLLEKKVDGVVTNYPNIGIEVLNKK